MKLTADLVEAFAGVFLSPMYDQPRPTPPFHRKMWELYCSDHPQCAIAAPRSHAKSTALTHDFGLATVLFREQDYAIVLGSTEEMAIDHLGDIATELRDNDDIRREFGIVGFPTDQKTDIIVECDDGHQFRLIARGAEQKIRGKKWRGKRPGLILGDDIEDDEQVESKDRRQKFYRWLMRAAKQALRDGGKMRLHGTILHEDSALAKLMKDRTWKTLCFRAHNSFDDFSDILWPEMFPEARLRAVRQGFIEAMDAAGYSQEYLNDPFDNSDAYLRRIDFLAANEEDLESDKVVCVGVDFAISKADKSNRTSFTVGGRDPRNIITVLDQYVGRWDGLEIVDQFFIVQSRWQPECFFVEGGQIWNAIERMIYDEMRDRDMFLNIHVLNPVKDKAARGKPFQKRHRAGAIKFDKSADWYPSYEAELLRFTGVSEAVLDDQFDSTALLVKGIEALGTVEEQDFDTPEEVEFERQAQYSRGSHNGGRSPVTGY